MRPVGSLMSAERSGDQPVPEVVAAGAALALAVGVLDDPVGVELDDGLELDEGVVLELGVVLDAGVDAPAGAGEEMVLPEPTLTLLLIDPPPVAVLEM